MVAAILFIPLNFLLFLQFFRLLLLPCLEVGDILLEPWVWSRSYCSLGRKGGGGGGGGETGVKVIVVWTARGGGGGGGGWRRGD